MNARSGWTMSAAGVRGRALLGSLLAVGIGVAGSQGAWADPVPSFPQLPQGSAPCPEGQSRTTTFTSESFSHSIPNASFSNGWSVIKTSTPDGSYAARSTMSGSSSDPTDYFFLNPVTVSGQSVHLAFASRGTQRPNGGVVSVNSYIGSVPASTDWIGRDIDLTDAAKDENGVLTSWFEQRYDSGRATTWDVDNIQLFGCSDNATSRIAGADRYAVSAAVADTFPVGTDTAYVARGDTFSDALAAVPVAAIGKAPILLVRPDDVPSTVASALQRLDPGRIVVLGGTSSVSPEVMTELGNYTTGGVTRVTGKDRYEVSAKLSESFPSGLDNIYIASGQVFPDALSGAPLAALNDSPLLLTDGTSVPPSIRDAVKRLAPKRVVLLGGTSTVSTAVRQELAALAGGQSDRIDGADRYEVSAKVAGLFSSTVSASYLATGADFPDSIIGAALAGARDQPLLITRGSSLSASTEAALDRLQEATGTVVGGPASVASIVRDQYGRTLP